MWRTAGWGLAAAVVLLTGCRTAGGGGPAPVAAISSISLPFFGKRELRESWAEWGRRNLQDGDLLFVMGESRVLLGLLNFSKFSAEIAESEFSHVGVVAIEDGTPMVYDISTDGALRRPFDRYVTDRRVWSVAVRRLHPSRQGCIPTALAYCRRVHEEDGKFDTAFRLDNDRLYCAELVETAFREGGEPLSAPIRIDALPGFARMPTATVRLVEATTSLSAEQEIYLPGNEHYGIWSCHWLATVLEKTDADSPPTLETRLPMARLPATR
jgi:hypothetical protein